MARLCASRKRPKQWTQPRPLSSHWIARTALHDNAALRWARIGRATRVGHRHDTHDTEDLTRHPRTFGTRRICTRTGSGKSARIELTERARVWIEKIWGPLRDQGGQLLESYPTRELSVMATFLQEARKIQERHTATLRTWLDAPSSRVGRNQLRGGLSPAALQRVKVFIEASLARPIHIADLAERAGLSEYHFARAFKTSVGTTPRAFVETRRIEKAKQLIEESNHPLVEIASQTGLGSQSRFTTAFRLATGVTPGAYRQARQ